MTATVLLIEDNVQNRYLATYLLEHHGYTVVPALDGPEGIALAESTAPDLVLLDIQLPGMDGYCVARALRELPGLRDTPIIAVTSYAMPADRARAMAAGCDGYIEKPIEPQTFAAQVAAHLDAPGDGTPR